MTRDKDLYLSYLNSEWEIARSHIEQGWESYHADLNMVCETHIESGRQIIIAIKQLQASAKEELDGEDAILVDHFAKNALTAVMGGLRALIKAVSDRKDAECDNNEHLWHETDGGRSLYVTGLSGDCAIRAIAIATGIDYKEVMDEMASIDPNRDPLEGAWDPTIEEFLCHRRRWQQFRIDSAEGLRVHNLCTVFHNTSCVAICQFAGANGHAVSIVDGKIYDRFNSGGMLTTKVFCRHHPLVTGPPPEEE